MAEQFPTDGLTREEDTQLAELLSMWNGGRISTRVFTILAGMTPQSIVEVVLLRNNSGTLETLLIPRPPDDIVWPEMWHTPGTALRNADFKREDGIPLNGALERIRREIGGDFAFLPVSVGNFYLTAERGSAVTHAFYTELKTEPHQSSRVWYPVDKLAENPKFIQGQLEFVKAAAEQYRLRVRR